MGYKQDAIIQIGKQRGYVLVDDVRRFYKDEDIKREMSKLILRGFFKQDYDGIKIKWVYIK